MTVAAFTSTGSKHPDVLYGGDATGLPRRMTSSNGCLVRADDGREYVDFIMGLGAVSLGYGHPVVTGAAIEAVRRGVVGPLSPVDEEATAAAIHAIMPWMEQVRFLKSGAEALAAAVRIARVATGRNAVLGCGYHGWLDWCSESSGVPAATRAHYGTLAFNDVQATIERIRAGGDSLACVVIEPVILGAPDPEWLRALREETQRVGAVLVFDEVKTAFRVAPGGAAERWGVVPDLMVLGKALANGFPLAAVGGSARLMARVRETWISSTLATEFVSLAAAHAALRVTIDESVPAHIAAVGGRLWDGLAALCRTHPHARLQVRGIPGMCHLEAADAEISRRITIGCAERGLLWKRNAYNFVSLAHDNPTIDAALATLDQAIDAAGANRPETESC